MSRTPNSLSQISSWEGLASAILKWRKENGKTQKELGDEIGVSQSLIAQVEKGEPVSPINVQRIGGKLAIDVSALRDSDRRDYKTLLAFCGSTRCPNLRLAANYGELFVAPMFYAIKKLSADSCPFCNLPLHRACPACSQPINERRLACAGCQERFVQIPESLLNLTHEELQSLSDQWDERNRRIREHLGYT